MSKGQEALTRKVDRMSLPDMVKENLYGMGVTTLTEIQQKAFDPILRGRNFVGRSRTGSGKTVAYLLPVLERLRHEKIVDSHSVLILVPTRELCKQVGGVVVTLAVTTDVALVFGGPSLASQEELVRHGPRVVVATPGRCAQLITRGALKPKQVRVLIIDEADAMLGLEYSGRVERILSAVAKPGLQTILFSASMPPDIQSVIRERLGNHESVDLVDRGGLRGASPVQEVSHLLCKVPKAQGVRVLSTVRARVLLHLLATRLDASLGARCIIFVDSTAEAKALLSHPRLASRRTRALHSDSTAEDRDMALTAFANREFDVLITTDVVSRGVDFEDISLVLQLKPPRDASHYVHRAGRTGRAGRGGTVITLYDPSEHVHVQRMREATRQTFRMESTPGPDDIHRAAVSRLLDELHAVQPEEFGPFLQDAEELLSERGPHVLATAMAILDSRHAELAQAKSQAPSLLTGRQGFLCLHVHDPEHQEISSVTDVRRILLSVLDRGNSKAAAEDMVGKITQTVDGWAVDVEQHAAVSLVEDLRTGRRDAGLEISVSRQLPRLQRVVAGRSRRVPWASMRKSARKRRTLGLPTRIFGPGVARK